MGVIKQIDIQFLQQNYWYQKFWFNLVKNRQKIIQKYWYLQHIAIKKIDDCENVYSVTPLYLIVDHASGYIDEIGVNKYLIFDSTDENKELLKNRIMFGMELETKSRK